MSRYIWILRKIIEYIVRGGWPASLGLPVESAALLPKEYLEAVLSDDIYVQMNCEIRLGSFGRVQDIAIAVVFLASVEAK